MKEDIKVASLYTSLTIVMYISAGLLIGIENGSAWYLIFLGPMRVPFPVGLSLHFPILGILVALRRVRSLRLGGIILTAYGIIYTAYNAFRWPDFDQTWKHVLNVGVVMFPAAIALLSSHVFLTWHAITSLATTGKKNSATSR